MNANLLCNCPDTGAPHFVPTDCPGGVRNIGPLGVGDQFTRTDARPYTENGTKGVHDTTVLCEIVSTDERGFQYKVVKMIRESGRPSFAGTPTGGTMAWFGWDAALAKGRVEVV
jgi:hypothetical protein